MAESASTGLGFYSRTCPGQGRGVTFTVHRNKLPARLQEQRQVTQSLPIHERMVATLILIPSSRLLAHE